jgi:hypothetical protein
VRNGAFAEPMAIALGSVATHPWELAWPVIVLLRIHFVSFVIFVVRFSFASSAARTRSLEQMATKVTKVVNSAEGGIARGSPQGNECRE